MTEFFIFLVFGFVCVCLGYFIAPIVRKDGTFEMDSDDPSKDIWRLVLDIDVEDIAHKKYLIFKVDPNAHLSGGRIDERF